MHFKPLYLVNLFSVERERGRERERQRERGGGREREICATNIKLTLVRKLSIVW